MYPTQQDLSAHRRLTLHRPSNATVILALCAALLASGPIAAQQPTLERGWSTGGSELTPEERSLRQQRHDYIDSLVLNASVEKGAIAGGIALAGCLLLSEKKRKRCIAVALGVGAGTFLYSQYVDSKRVKTRENEVLDAEAMADDLEREVESLRRLNADARQVAVQNNQRIVALRARVHAEQISMSDAQRERARIEDNVNAVTETLKASKKELAGWESVLEEARTKGGSVQRLEQEIEQKRIEVYKLEQLEDEMLEQLQAVPTLGSSTPSFYDSEEHSSGGSER